MPSTPTITVFLGTNINEDAFTLNHATRGQLNDATFTLGGDVGTEITAESYAVSINRGRSRELDDFTAGTAVVELRNYESNYSVIDQNAPNYGLLVPGRRVTIEMYGQTLFAGVTEKWESFEEPDGTRLARLTAHDALAQLARIEFSAWSPTNAQTADERLTSALNRSEVNFAASRDFDVGISELQGGSVDQGENVLNYCQLVARSDLGLFFASRDNTLTFRNRHEGTFVIGGIDIAFTLTDVTPPSDLLVSGPFSSYQTADSSERLYNRVQVTREGGTTQTADDTDSQDSYGIRTLSVGEVLLKTDEEALSYGEFLLGLFKDPVARVDTMSVNVTGLEEVSGLNPGPFARADIGDFIAVSISSDITGFAAFTLRIEGVSHDIAHGQSHVMTLTLSEPGGALAFVLDDINFAILDTSVLGF